jgi:hypothetical protein
MAANGKEEDNVIPTLLSVTEERDLDVQTTMFLSMLFDFLDVDLNAKESSISSYARIFESSSVNFRIEEKLTPDDWIPNSASKNEHDFTPESVKERVNKVIQWFNGKKTTTEYLRELKEGTDDE